MPKSRTKIKKTILTPHAAIIGLTDELDLSICCSNRNCPSHWHDRLTEKLKNLQQSKSKTSPSLVPKTKLKANYKLSYPDILSQLFRIEQSDEIDNEEIYSIPIPKSVILEKHNAFSKQVETMLNDSTYSFMRNNLNPQMQYRLIPLVADIFSDQV